MKRLFSAVMMVMALFVGAQNAPDEQLRFADNLRHEDVLLPLSTPDRSGFIVMDYVMILDEDGLTAILACYDDPQTKLRIDYIELYNLSGDLLLVNWIDRFGISRFAMDRGLFEEYPVVDRVLVLMTAGVEL